MLSAAVLAGGRATRFSGRDKSTLIVDGAELLERQLEQVLRLTDDVMVVGRDGRPAPSMVSVRSIPDRVPGMGPLGGLDAALAAARHRVVVVIACDMPYVTAQLLRHLADLADDVDAVVPRTERGAHPLCAAYRHTCREAVTRRLADGRLAMTALLGDLVVRDVAREDLRLFGDPDRLLANVNTAEDYDALPSHVR